MDIVIGQLAQVESIAGSSNVPFLVPIPLELAVVARDQHVSSNIKLTVVVE